MNNFITSVSAVFHLHAVTNLLEVAISIVNSPIPNSFALSSLKLVIVSLLVDGFTCYTFISLLHVLLFHLRISFDMIPSRSLVLLRRCYASDLKLNAHYFLMSIFNRQLLQLHQERSSMCSLDLTKHWLQQILHFCKTNQQEIFDFKALEAFIFIVTS